MEQKKQTAFIYYEDGKIGVNKMKTSAPHFLEFQTNDYASWESFVEKIPLPKNKTQPPEANGKMIPTQAIIELARNLKTPLASIIGFVEIINKYNKDKNLENFIKAISFNSRHLYEQIEDIDVFSASSLQNRSNFDLINIPFEIEALVNDFNGPFSKSSLDVELHTKGLIPEFVYFNSDIFKKLMRLLLKVKFNQLESTKLFVEISFSSDLENEHDRLMINIKGQKKENLEQENKNILDQIQYTVIQQLFEELGGKVDFSFSQNNFRIEVPIKTPSESSFFKIERPKEDFALEEKTENVFNLRKNLKGTKLLLVEDSTDLQLLVTNYLKPHEVEIDCADDGVEAINKLEKKPYDIVLMDLQMPRMSGQDCQEKIKAMGIGTPIIAFTASSDLADRQSCLKSGFSGYLTKPFLEKDLVHNIKEVLANEISLDPSPAKPWFDIEDDLEIKAAFQTNLTKQTERIKQALKNLDFLELEHGIHQLKGSALCFGKTVISNICLSIENHLKEGNPQIDFLEKSLKQIEIEKSLLASK